jgi:hypothetical protein
MAVAVPRGSPPRAGGGARPLRLIHPLRERVIAGHECARRCPDNAAWCAARPTWARMVDLASGTPPLSRRHQCQPTMRTAGERVTRGMPEAQVWVILLLVDRRSLRLAAAGAFILGLALLSLV